MAVHSTLKGFTLLELIIVIIIVGVLASLALPRFFTMIESSKVTEALMRARQFVNLFEVCLHQNGGQSYSPCEAADNLMQEYIDEPNKNFIYTVGYGQQAGVPVYAIRMTQWINNNSNPSNEIMLRMNSTGAVTIQGTGIYSNINM